MARTCNGLNKDGEPCGGKPSKGKGYCYHHVPEKEVRAEDPKHITSFWAKPNVWRVLSILLTAIGFVGGYYTASSSSAERQEISIKADSIVAGIDSIAALNEYVAQLNQNIADDVERAELVVTNLKDDQERHFELANRPEVLIWAIGVKSGKYVVTVKNHGGATATNVTLSIDYKVIPAGGKTLITISNLPKNEATEYVFDILNHYDHLLHNPHPTKSLKDLKARYDSVITDFNNGERSMITRLLLDYDWDGKHYQSKEYTIVFGRDKMSWYQGG